jgi:hypothetical protein
MSVSSSVISWINHERYIKVFLEAFTCKTDELYAVKLAARLLPTAWGWLERGDAKGTPKDGRCLSCSAHDFEPWREFIVANGELRAPA